LAECRQAPGLTRTSSELLAYWKRDGRDPSKRLFFAQFEAAETIIFLTEARDDFRQGISIKRDEPDLKKKSEGFSAFERRACKLATGGGKTTVMAMLAAWSILNKTANRGDSRFSDVVLVVCPNVTIRSRLQEIDPERGEASLYCTRDLVPPHLSMVFSKCTKIDREKCTTSDSFLSYQFSLLSQFVPEPVTIALDVYDD
jgi:type III restriction enzyme